jgi:hypothetical protein
MHTKVSSYEQIESFKKDEALINISTKQKASKLNPRFISSLYAKITGRISKIKNRKILSSKTLTSDQWCIE